MFIAFAVFIAFLLLAAFAIWGEKIMSRGDAKFLVGLLAFYAGAFILSTVVVLACLFLVIALVVAALT